MKRDMPAFTRNYDADGHNGMTVRQVIASRALQGFCANPSIFASNGMSGWDLVNCTEDELCASALSIADTIIRQMEG